MLQLWPYRSRQGCSGRVSRLPPRTSLFPTVGRELLILTVTGYRLPVTGKNMKYVRPYKTLDVYTVAKALVIRVYDVLQTFHNEEQYALCDQLRRAVISIPSNVAEGLGRMSEKEQLRFIEIAYGSLLEVETQLDIACDLHYITPESISDIMELIDREARLLSCLRSHRLKPRNP